MQEENAKIISSYCQENMIAGSINSQGVTKGIGRVICSRVGEHDI